MEQVAIGKFFVWTKHGRRPRKSHDTHKKALCEAHRLAGLHPGRRFIVQEFHEKVFVDVEPSPLPKRVTTMEKNMKKKLWAGVVNGQIEFFNSNPQDTVQGLQGSRQFTVTGDCELHDANGNNAINSASADLGTDSAGTIQQAVDNTQPTGGAAS